ncbi:MAG: hypothetical protein Q9174_007137, partial [Haloplaca sp. 1 TL-2023]
MIDQMLLSGIFQETASFDNPRSPSGTQPVVTSHSGTALAKEQLPTTHDGLGVPDLFATGKASLDPTSISTTPAVKTGSDGASSTVSSSSNNIDNTESTGESVAIETARPWPSIGSNTLPKTLRHESHVNPISTLSHRYGLQDSSQSTMHDESKNAFKAPQAMTTSTNQGTSGIQTTDPDTRSVQKDEIGTSDLGFLTPGTIIQPVSGLPSANILQTTQPINGASPAATMTPLTESSSSNKAMEHPTGHEPDDVVVGQLPSAQRALTMPYITPTLTTLPPAVSIQTITDEALTSNMWLTTTTSDEKTAIVPVIVGCPQCGGKGGSLILWNFPPNPMEFPDTAVLNIPKIGLPKITFPCSDTDE